MSALVDRIFSLKRRGHNNFEIANVVGLTPAQVVARLKDPSLADPSTGVGLLPEAPGGPGGGAASPIRVTVEDFTLEVAANEAQAYGEPVKVVTVPLAVPRLTVGLVALIAGGTALPVDQNYTRNLVFMVTPEGEAPQADENGYLAPILSLVAVTQPDGTDSPASVSQNWPTNSIFVPIAAAGPDGLDADPVTSVDIHIAGSQGFDYDSSWDIPLIELLVY